MTERFDAGAAVAELAELLAPGVARREVAG
jgi:hypothetical protein